MRHTSSIICVMMTLLSEEETPFEVLNINLYFCALVTVMQEIHLEGCWSCVLTNHSRDGEDAEKKKETV